MPFDLNISYRDIEPSEFVDARIRKEAGKFERFSDRITSCRVVVSAQHRSQRKGMLYAARIHLVLPGGGDIVVDRDPQDKHSHEDVYVAIRDAFKAATRQLEDFVRERRGDVKTHETPAHGAVTNINGHQGYGFITSSEGREVYFHRNSVLDAGFDALEIGDKVRFAQTPGEKGPQASTVTAIGKHNLG